MPDLNRESLEIWNSLKPMVDEEIKSQTRGAVQRRKAKVTTAPSLSTNKIGVTEPYCAEIFIPFVSNLISATVGDYVWIEFAYGATNAYASMFASSDHKDETVAGNLYVMGNVNVGGVLDVTNRRTNAVSLSELGWHRAINIATSWRGAMSFAVDICIGRVYNSTNNEIHRITLLVNWDSFAFVNETSKSNTNIISAIRYTHDSNNGYIDIQYSSLSENDVYVDFAVHCHPTIMANFTAQSLQLVAASPSGETVLTTYPFTANTNDYEDATKDANFSASTFTLTGYRRGDIIIYRWNINVPALTAATYYNMGTFSNIVLPNDRSITWAGQGTGQYLINFQPSGLVRIYSNSATSAQFCRGSVTFPA